MNSKITWMKIKYYSRNLAVWFWFGFVLSILPIALAVWKLIGQNRLPWNKNLMAVISHGELFLICISLIGVSIGELIKEDTDWKTIRIILIGISLTASLFSIYAYSEISTAGIDIIYIYRTSLSVMIGAVLIGISSLILPKKREAMI